MRTGSGCRILLSVKRTHTTRSDAGYTMDGTGEIVPRADTLVAEVEDSRRHILRNGGIDGTGQIAGIGRCTYLVKDNSQLLLLSTKANHGLYKVVAKGDLVIINDRYGVKLTETYSTVNKQPTIEKTVVQDVKQQARPQAQPPAGKKPEDEPDYSDFDDEDN